MEKFLSSVGDSADPADPEVKEPINAFARSTTVTGSKEECSFCLSWGRSGLGRFLGGKICSTKTALFILFEY